MESPRTRSFRHWIAAGLMLITVGLIPNVASAQNCNQVFAYYNNSNWWWGAFGNCKSGPGGLTDRTAIFECAWAQVPANDRSNCLKEQLFGSAQTRQGIDAVVAYNTRTCDQLFAYYNNSNWWWGAFGNCKTGRGGITDRTAIFECAWAQIPALDQTDCLKGKLTQSAQTSQGIDAVVAYNGRTCDQLFGEYNDSAWWWGAFGNCKTGENGPWQPNDIFDCAWAQVPAVDQTECLRDRLRMTNQTALGIADLQAYNYSYSSPLPGPILYYSVGTPPAAAGKDRPPATVSKPCERATFIFNVFCGTAFANTIPMEACTRPDALELAKKLLGIGCYINETTGIPEAYTPETPQEACKKKSFKYCVSCDSGSGPSYSQTTVDACLESEALAIVTNSRAYFCSANLFDKSCPEPKK